MAYAQSFREVQVTLSNRGASLVAQTPRGDLYYDAYGKWIRVARSGSGYQVDFFGSRAECGCG
jgi:hypothetical protein